jgi:hypothetical protein
LPAARFQGAMAMAKVKKTTVELTALIMTEIRKHPECDHIRGIGFTRPMQVAPHHPNWAPAWSTNGPKTQPPIADEIARQFQNKFDLA